MFIFILFSGVTAHYIDDNARPNYRVLSTIPLKELHKTGQMISTKLEEALFEYQIDRSKIHIATRDGGSNMILGFRMASIESFHCFLHVLNLSIKVCFILEKSKNHKFRRVLKKLNLINLRRWKQ